MIGQALGHVVQVPLETLARHLVADGFARGDLAIVAQPGFQGLVEFSEPGRIEKNYPITQDGKSIRSMQNK